MPSNIDIEKLKIQVDIWKTVIDTQKHFNDLEMKVRNFGILVLSAFIGAIGVSFNSGYFVSFHNINASVASILSLGATVIWLLIYFVDVHWYHPLLLGAVKHGIAIENTLKTDLPEIGLTLKIGAESPSKILWIKDVHSTTKARIFYIGIFIVLTLSTTGLFIAEKPIQNEKNNVVEVACSRDANYSGYKCTFNGLPPFKLSSK